MFRDVSGDTSLFVCKKKEVTRLGYLIGVYTIFVASIIVYQLVVAFAFW